MIALRGVRSSWLILAMNNDFAWAACSAITVLSVKAAVSTLRIRTRIQAQPPATAAINSSEITASAFSSGSFSPIMSWETILLFHCSPRLTGNPGKLGSLMPADPAGTMRASARLKFLVRPERSPESKFRKYISDGERLCPFGAAFQSRGPDGRDAEKNRALAQLDEPAARALTIFAFFGEHALR